MLIVGAIACCEANLTERVVESSLLGNLSKLSVVVDVPTGALLDVGNDQPARNVGNPIGKFEVVVRVDIVDPFRGSEGIRMRDRPRSMGEERCSFVGGPLDALL